MGIFPIDKALKASEEHDLDLVEIAPSAKPPVCRIMDFAKYKYDQEKKEREAKKHQKAAQLKEIRVRPGIDDHDYQVKVKHIQEFLKKGHKVRVRLFFRGREMAHQEIGRKVLEKMVTDLEPVGKVEKDARSMGRAIIMIFGPK